MSSPSRTPLVSVIIPTYYRNDDLRSAIESSLDQTHERVEVIIVDDSGERHAKEVATEYDVCYISHNQNRGGNPARSTGIDHAKGEYIQLLDDDDYLHPHKLGKCVSILESNENIGVAYCGYEWEGTKKMPTVNYRGDVLKPLLYNLRLVPCVPSTMLIDSTILDSITPLTPRPCKEGLGIRIELAQRTRFDYVDEALVTRQKSEDSRSSSPEAIAETIRIVNEYRNLYDKFDRRIRHRNLNYLYTRESIENLQNNQKDAALSASSKALYHMVMSRQFRIKTVGVAGISIFGKPGYQFIRTIKNKLSNQ